MTVSGLSPTALDAWAKKEIRAPAAEEPVGADALWVTDPEEETQAYEDLLAPPAFLAGAKKATAAEAGTATHVFMQFCDLARLKEHGVRAELARLREEKFLPTDMASLVKLTHVEKFLRSPLFEEMEEAASLKREFRFNLLLPADHFTADPVRKKHLAGEQILVQCVIDCLLFYPDGRYVLIDYKTDYLTEEERKNPDLAAAKLRARHGNQLAYYGLACEKMLGSKPEKIVIYSLPLGDSVVL
jgi:ATP-dependent helicase/nuclease subunit A